MNEDWGPVQGELPKPPAPRRQRKYEVRSGNEKVTGQVPDHDPVRSGAATLRQKRQVLLAMRMASKRIDTPVAEWNAYDLAQAWRERLWATGNRVDLGGLRALAARFKDLQQAGVSNEDIEAISEAFFAFPPDSSKDMFRSFISRSTALLNKVRPQGLQASGYYGPLTSLFTDMRAEEQQENQ